MAKLSKSIYAYFRDIDDTVKTADEMIKSSGLDFEVAKVPIFYRTKDIDKGNGQIIPGTEIGCARHAATVRMDTEAELGVVGINYGIYQYKEAFDFSEIMVSEGKAGYVKAGEVENGARGFVIMRTSEFMNIGVGDNIYNYFFLTTCHNGKGHIEVFPGFYRPSNSTIMTFDGSQGFKFRHSKHVKQRVVRAHEVITKIHAYWKETTETFKLLSELKITDEQARNYFKMLLENDNTRSENIRDAMFGIYKTGISSGLPTCSGTLLGAYMAAVEHADHHKTVKKSDLRDERSAKILSGLTGEAARSKAEAYSMVLNLKAKFGGAWRAR